MKKSELENNVLQCIVEGDADQDILTEQIELASVLSREYTGVGFYTKFDIPENTRRFKSNRWKIEDMPGTYAEHPLLPAGASFILWLKDGLINTLEGYTNEGAWPKDESQFKVFTPDKK